jgi:curved DNA-binding protein CbpA
MDRDAYAKDYYAILRCTPEDDISVIKRAWTFRMAQLNQRINRQLPDRAATLAAQDANQAWETLSDPARRAHYDKWYAAFGGRPTDEHDSPQQEEPSSRSAATDEDILAKPTRSSSARFGLGAALMAAFIVAVVVVTLFAVGSRDSSANGGLAASRFGITTTVPGVSTSAPTKNREETIASNQTTVPTEGPPVTAVPTATSAPAQQPSPLVQPTPLAPTATTTPQQVVASNGDYIRLVSKSVSGGSGPSITIDYSATVRPGGAFYVSATGWANDPQYGYNEFCAATATQNLPAS